MFESDQPHFYSGEMSDSEALLSWVKQFVKKTDAMDEAVTRGDDEVISDE